MIDVHAHFAEEGYDFPAEWEKIRAAGVNTVILASDTVPHSQLHAAFARAHEGCFFAAGVHPSDALRYDKAAEAQILRLATERKCVAIGEIGLDYHYGSEEKEAQRAAFVAQIELASRLGLPLQIHSRDACADTLSILREYQKLLSNGFLMHCYSYGAENLQAFFELGAYFSFGGVVCFKNARRAVEAVQACPLERILTETDSPYLSPFLGEKNSPSNIPVILQKLALVKDMDMGELMESINENALRLFPKLAL